MTPKPVKVYTNKKDGMSSYVFEGKGNTFSVSLRDDDAEMFCYFSQHGYKTLEAACTKAQEVMGPVPGSVGTVWAPVW